MPPKGGKVVKKTVVPVLTERQQIKLLEEQAKEAAKTSVQPVDIATPKGKNVKRGAKIQDDIQEDFVVPVVESVKKVMQVKAAVTTPKSVPKNTSIKSAVKTTPKSNRNRQIIDDDDDDEDDSYDGLDDDEDDGSADLAHQSMDLSSIGKTPSKGAVGSRSSSRNNKKQPDRDDSPIDAVIDSDVKILNSLKETSVEVSTDKVKPVSTIPKKTNTRSGYIEVEITDGAVAVDELKVVKTISTEVVTSTVSTSVMTSPTSDSQPSSVYDSTVVPSTNAAIRKQPKLIFNSPESTTGSLDPTPSAAPPSSSSHLSAQIKADLENMRKAASGGNNINIGKLSGSQSSGALSTSIDKLVKKASPSKAPTSAVSISYKKKDSISKQSLPFVQREPPGKWVRDVEDLMENNEILTSAKSQNTNTMTSSYHPEPVAGSNSGAAAVSSQWGSYLAVTDDQLRDSCKIGYKPNKNELTRSHSSSNDSKRHASVLDSWMSGDLSGSNKTQKVDAAMPPPSSSQTTTSTGARNKLSFPTSHRKPINSTFKYDPYSIYPPCEEGFALDQSEREQMDDMRTAYIQSSTALKDANIIFGRNKEWLHPETEFTAEAGDFTLSSALAFWGIRPCEPLTDSILLRGATVDQEIARRQAEIAREAARKQAELEAAAAQKVRMEEERKAREAKRAEEKRRAEENKRKYEEKRIEDARIAEEKKIENLRRAEEKRLNDYKRAEEKLAAEKAEREARVAQEQKRKEEDHARRIEQERLREIDAQKRREINAKAERERSDRERERAEKETIRRHEQKLEQERQDKLADARREQERLKQANSLQQSAMNKLQPNGGQVSSTNAASAKTNRFASTSNKGSGLVVDSSSAMPPNLSINPFEQQPLNINKAPPLVIKAVANLNSSLPSLNAAAAAAAKINAQLTARPKDTSLGGDPVFAAVLQQAASVSSARATSPVAVRPVPALIALNRMHNNTAPAPQENPAPPIPQTVTPVPAPVVATKPVSAPLSTTSLAARASIAQQVSEKRDGGRRDDSRPRDRDRDSRRGGSRERKREREDSRERRDGHQKRGRDDSRERGGGGTSRHHSSAPKKDSFGREIPAKPSERDARDHKSSRRDEPAVRSAPPPLIDTNNKEQMAQLPVKPAVVLTKGWEEVPISSVEEKKASMAFYTLSSNR